MRCLKRLCVLLLALLLPLTSVMAEMPTVTLDPNANPYDAEHPELLEADQLYAHGAILIEQDSGEVIFEKNPDQLFYPASTTKIMTVLLGIINCQDLNEMVTVSYNGSEAAMELIDPDATTIGLHEGEQLSMRDLLTATLIRSGNDGAVAIAEHVAGSEWAFVNLMNQTAEQLGMTNTHFVNPHGLHDDQHYSTARDLAILARFAMQNETFRSIAATKTYSMARTNMQRARTITTRHRIMLSTWRDESNRYYYAPMTGIKSGSHSMAAYCYVGSATKDGVDLISVVLYSDSYGVMTDTKKLMEYGFSQYENVTIQELYNLSPITVYTSGYDLDDVNLGRLPLTLQAVDQTVSAELTATKTRIAYLKDHLRDVVTVDYVRDFEAPIEAGEKIGTLVYKRDDGTDVVFDLVASRTVARRTNMPLTYEEIVAKAQADKSIPLTTEVVLIFASPFIVFSLIVLTARFLYRRWKKRTEHLPKNSNHYVK